MIKRSKTRKMYAVREHCKIYENEMTRILNPIYKTMKEAKIRLEKERKRNSKHTGTTITFYFDILPFNPD